jgi:hypothetical protein
LGAGGDWKSTHRRPTDKRCGDRSHRGSARSRIEASRPKAWTNPEPLLNGKDLTGWEPFPAGAANHWVREDGLLNTEHGANLKTTRKFEDFKLHTEYNCPEDGNSGIYPRGRDEIQVAYEKPGVNDKFHDMGAIYGFLAPAVELPRKPGQWESFDVTLVGRYLTIIRDGVKTVDNQEIPGFPAGLWMPTKASRGHSIRKAITPAV